MFSTAKREFGGSHTEISATTAGEMDESGTISGIHAEPTRKAMVRKDVQLSVIVVLRDPAQIPPVRELYYGYKEHVEATGLSHEFIFVVDGDHRALFEELLRLKEDEENLSIIKFAKWYGDATALSAGFDLAGGEVILTLPAYYQIDPSAIPRLLDALDGYDLVAVRRWPRKDSWRGRLQTRAFHAVLKAMMGVELNDITCGVRLFRRKVIETVNIYGDQHRFLPVLVSRYGFRIREVEIPQHEQEASRRSAGAGSYVSRALDLVSIFFLVKFTKKPLRFFGSTGLIAFLAGLIFTAVLAYQRLFLEKALADRPALLLGLLLMVLGVQLFALGIVGELVIFTNARQMREYTIEKIVN